MRFAPPGHRHLCACVVLRGSWKGRRIATRGTPMSSLAKEAAYPSASDCFPLPTRPRQQAQGGEADAALPCVHAPWPIVLKATHASIRLEPRWRATLVPPAPSSMRSPLRPVATVDGMWRKALLHVRHMLQQLSQPRERAPGRNSAAPLAPKISKHSAADSTLTHPETCLGCYPSTLWYTSAFVCIESRWARPEKRRQPQQQQ